MRPDAPIVAATDDAGTARCLSICRGVLPMVCDLNGDLEEVITRAVAGAVTLTAAPANATTVVVNTTADLDRGSSNFVRLRRA
jgi:pyruvate kinase